MHTIHLTPPPYPQSIMSTETMQVPPRCYKKHALPQHVPAGSKTGHMYEQKEEEMCGPLKATNKAHHKSHPPRCCKPQPHPSKRLHEKKQVRKRPFPSSVKPGRQAGKSMGRGMQAPRERTAHAPYTSVTALQLIPNAQHFSHMCATKGCETSCSASTPAGNLAQYWSEAPLHVACTR